MCHRIGIGIRVGVHTDAVDADSLNPPDAVLNEIAHEMGIVLVQVGHGGNKPALRGLFQVNLRSIRVEHGGEFIRGLQIGRLSRFGTIGIGGKACYRVAAALFLREPVGGVEPVFRWHVMGPGMLITTMVENHIHHYLQPLGMSLIAKTLVIGIGTKTGIDLIIIGGGIAVICRETVLLIRRVVLQNGRKPKGRDTQLLEIVKVFADAIQVTAMTKRRLCAILLITAHTLYLRVMTLALCETVGHEHVEHIGIGKAHTLVATHLTGLQLILHLGLVELQCHRTRLGILQVHIDQKVVG